MNDQTHPLEWNEDGVPISQRFDDPYFSMHDGLAETRHVFLGGNDLFARFVDGFHIAELGFGTGLNLLATLKAWRQSGAPGVLQFTSFEAFPLARDQMAMALKAFPEMDELASELLGALTGAGAKLHDLKFNLIIGDAREALPQWGEKADAWFLDGFSPAKNPELWEGPLMHAVGDHTNTGGTVATYTAAGFVRRALGDAGFDVERVTGYGRKRHMTVGSKRA
ncbi:tRNA (5-methylaminomethyl-2-thiouridine)(34)-methyltransferase MnmD [Planktotalea sp.]|uniref:tRNA (5-methylaminomethyl-2-thiouridine)(34)-methyltransferase MnmD n=1 Tax=Planktotalea sp. TaxID=2029877 RepID=UPI0025F7997A|nr:tRNA (5-methylaminomethyl-2-thiouridine)(34)-methyltransferase MnmD [Planktotalea sp.]